MSKTLGLRVAAVLLGLVATASAQYREIAPAFSAEDYGVVFRPGARPLGYGVDLLAGEGVSLPYMARGAATSLHPGRPQVGLRRALPDGAWRTGRQVRLPDGRLLWRMVVHSPGATSIRVHFSEFSVGSGEVWVYAPPQAGQPVSVVGPYSQRGPFQDGDFWSASVRGPDAVIDYRMEPGSPAAVPPTFRVDAVAHQWSATWDSPHLLAQNTTAAGLPAPPPESAHAPDDPGASGFVAADPAPCHLDATCYPSWADFASGVAMFRLVGDDGGVYDCSGALLNTRSSSGQPYFLTANHCIGSEAEARSMQTYFDYQTSSCGGPPPDISTIPFSLGAHLLETRGRSEGDFSLVLLSGVPGRRYYLGWSAAAPSMADSLVGIHHPRGSWKRISFGSRTSDGSTYVDGELAPAARFYRVQYSEGRLEPGSSGSPLLNTNGQVLGTAAYAPITPPGETVCDVDPEVVGYGRFSNAYPVILPYLEDAPAPLVTASPASLTFSVDTGTVSPAHQSLSVQAISAAAVSFTAQASASWLRLSATGGTVSSLSSATLDVSLDASAFTGTGAYSATITIKSGTMVPLVIPVQVNAVVRKSLISGFITPNPVYQQAPDADGYSWFYRITLQERAGVSTRLTSFSIDGNDLSSSIGPWFGTTTLAGGGTVSASVRVKGLRVPLTRSFVFSGADVLSGRTWTYTISAQFLPLSSQAVMDLTSMPEPVRQNPASATCPWFHQVVVQETAGVAVQLNRFMAAGYDLSSRIAGYFGGIRLPPNGRLQAPLCWKSVSVPSLLTLQLGGQDDNGNPVQASVDAKFLGPLQTAISLSASPPNVRTTVASGSSSPTTYNIAVNVGQSSVAWTAGLAFAAGGGYWATAFPLSGIGSGTITLVISPAGLSGGAYQAQLSIVAPDATPALVVVPITLQVGPGSGGVSVISAVVNGASFQPALAPGAIFSVFGSNLAQSVQAAQTVPLPDTLAGTRVTINGLTCPLYYASPGQINAQIPIEVGVGPALVMVSAGGPAAYQSVTVAGVAPGLFNDGRAPVPFGSGRRGDIVVIYITGQGLLSPPVPTGTAPLAGTPVESLPKPVEQVEVSVGGVLAPIYFAGDPWGLVGLIQINFQVPNVGPGDQLLSVRVGGSVSNTVHFTVLP